MITPVKTEIIMKYHVTHYHKVWLFWGNYMVMFQLLEEPSVRAKEVLYLNAFEASALY